MARVLRIRVYDAPEGLKAEIVASPSLWREVADQPGTCRWRADAEGDVALAVHLDDHGSGRRLAYQLAEVRIETGPEDHNAARDPDPYDVLDGPFLR